MKNLPFEPFSSFDLDDMTAVFRRCGEKMLFTLLPAVSKNRIPEHRRDLNETVGFRDQHRVAKRDALAVQPDSMVQVQDLRDALANNPVLRNGETVDKLRFERQYRKGNSIFTEFAVRENVRIVQELSHTPGEPYATIRNSVENHSAEEVELALLESFSLNMLSPFHADDAPDSLILHRFRSFWSAEGRHEATPVEDLELTQAWDGAYPRAIRFGQRSSMAVKEFFPTVGLEDAENGITWAAELATVTPWQITAYRSGDFLSISGGYPDLEFAGWRHTVRPGETFQSIPAVVTCCAGDIQDALARLTRYSSDHAVRTPETEKELPLIFNEFCTTWGCPTEANLKPVIDGLKGLGIRYFVMDAGWFREPESRRPGIGDWNIYEPSYPEGFDRLLDRVRENGMIPGIWFEFENVSQYSELFQNHPDWLVRWENRPYRLNTDRWFLDFRKQEVWTYLDEKVIGFLKKHRIGYMKVDYNAKFQFADTEHGSAADGVREILEAVREYFLHLRRELPELVLEICASGGNRLTAEWMRIGDMASFSDCHEALSAPLVAAQTALLIPGRASQVWAVLRKDEEERRTVYSLAAGFLGRLCLSGNAEAYSEFQRESIRKAGELYRNNLDILRDGVPRLERRMRGKNDNHPKGYQLFRRRTGRGEVIVLHAFANAPEELKIPISGRLAGSLSQGVELSARDGFLTVSQLKDFSGVVAVIRNETDSKIV